MISGDSLVAGLSRYFNNWEMHFVTFNTLNYGIREGLIGNIFWHSNDLPLLSSVKYVIILWGTNNLHKDSPYEIVDGLIATVYILEKNTITLKLLFAVYFQKINLGL